MKEYYTRLVVTSLAEILKRSAGTQNGGFINTKFSLLSGDDFSVDDSVRGLDTIYSWIQGRGLEALAVHYTWLKRDGSVSPETAEKLSRDCLSQLSVTFEAMEKLRRLNGGRLLFMHDAASSMPVKIGLDGKTVAVELDPAGPSTMSELFYVKGMAAAADVLNDVAKLDEAKKWYDKIHADIVANLFVNDQQPLDPKNVAARPVQGRLSHGPRMIALGAAFRFLDITGEEKYLRYGLEYLDYILENHINLGLKDGPGEKYDMWEFTREGLSPYYDDENRLMCDPGHATEFTGLAGKLLAVADRRGLGPRIARLDDYKKLLPAILRKNFDNGFSENGYGICKAFDLVSRQPINSDMPWWPLPETMRSACLAMDYASPEEHETCRGILLKCSEAFRKFFVQPDLHMMAYQTLGGDGRPVDVIPATPDADPGYHTNLSIIDCMPCLEKTQNPA